MFSADFAVGNANYQSWVVLVESRAIRIVPHWLPIVRFLLQSILCNYLRFRDHSFRPVIGCPWLSIRSRDRRLADRDESLQFRNAFGIKSSLFVANLAGDALYLSFLTLAFFFFFISKESRSEAQSRQRSWLQASMRISSGSFLHLVQGWGWSITTKSIITKLHIQSSLHHHDNSLMPYKKEKIILTSLYHNDRIASFIARNSYLLLYFIIKIDADKFGSEGCRHPPYDRPHC